MQTDRHWTKPRFFYHVTEKRWPKRKRLKPLHSSMTDRPAEEPSLARICVAPTVAQCLSAISYSGYYTYHIFRTLRRIKAKYPYSVADSRITNERWLTKPTSFIKIGSIQPRIMKSMPYAFCGSGYKQDLAKQKRNLEKIRQILHDCGIE